MIKSSNKFEFQTKNQGRVFRPCLIQYMGVFDVELMKKGVL